MKIWHFLRKILFVVKNPASLGLFLDPISRRFISTEFVFFLAKSKQQTLFFGFSATDKKVDFGRCFGGFWLVLASFGEFGIPPPPDAGPLGIVPADLSQFEVMSSSRDRILLSHGLPPKNFPRTKNDSQA